MLATTFKVEGWEKASKKGWLVGRNFDMIVSMYVCIYVNIKAKNDALVQALLVNEEVPEKVAEYLENGEAKLPKYYHVLKTHKIPT